MIIRTSPCRWRTGRPLAGRATITVFNDHLDDPDAVAARLAPFEVVCVMRERTPLTRGLLNGYRA